MSERHGRPSNIPTSQAVLINLPGAQLPDEWDKVIELELLEGKGDDRSMMKKFHVKKIAI